MSEEYYNNDYNNNAYYQDEESNSFNNTPPTNFYDEAVEYNNSIKNAPPARKPTKRENARVEIASSVFAVLNKPSLIDNDPSEYLPKPIVAPLPPMEIPKKEVPIPKPVEKKILHREGYLKKQGKKFKTWKKRYFILHQKKMQYFTEQNGSLIGTIEITDDCTVTLNLDKKGMIELHSPTRIWLFVADDDKIMNDWRNVIQDAIWLKNP